jgi:hypothetical protein
LSEFVGDCLPKGLEINSVLQVGSRYRSSGLLGRPRWLRCASSNSGPITFPNTPPTFQVSPPTSYVHPSSENLHLQPLTPLPGSQRNRSTQGRRQARRLRRRWLRRYCRLPARQSSRRQSLRYRWWSCQMPLARGGDWSREGL